MSQTVVVTYAAMAIERILAVKDRVPGQRSTLRLKKEQLVPFLESLFTGLFAVREGNVVEMVGGLKYSCKGFVVFGAWCGVVCCRGVWCSDSICCLSCSCLV